MPKPNTMDNWLDEFLDEIYQDKNTLGDLPLDKKLAKALITAKMQEVDRAAQTNGVAWAIEVIDELHIRTDSDLNAKDDRIYKGIKNTIRDRYKFITGIDPAPNYPIEASLKGGDV